jgi:carbon monoxide dehydrogenase subunit G
MAAEVTASTEVMLPVSVEEAWAVLSDTPRMVALDPLLDRYEPERGRIEAGTLNRVRTRLGPFRATLTTRTELLEPPRRAVFVSVSPSRPVRARTDDTLEPANGGCLYRATITVTPTLPLFGPLLARVMIRRMVAGRRRFMERLHTVIAEE